VKLIKYIIFVTVMVLSIGGCSGKPITFKSVNPLNYADVKEQKRVEVGQASGFQLLLFFPIKINSRHERAYNQLLKKADGDYVTNVRIKDSWTYAFIGTIYKTTITADIYPKSKNKSTIKN